jgi:hypothetical protein
MCATAVFVASAIEIVCLLYNQVGKMIIAKTPASWLERTLALCFALPESGPSTRFSPELRACLWCTTEQGPSDFRRPWSASESNEERELNEPSPNVPPGRVPRCKHTLELPIRFAGRDAVAGCSFATSGEYNVVRPSLWLYSMCLKPRRTVPRSRITDSNLDRLLAQAQALNVRSGRTVSGHE